MSIYLGTSELDFLRGKRGFCSWSGGKDCCLALHRARQAGVRIDVLVNMEPTDGERRRSHGMHTGIVRAQARSMGVRLEGEPTSWTEYEPTFRRVLGPLAEQGFEVAVFGDIDLQEHVDWEEKVCGDAGLAVVVPLWKADRTGLIRELVDAGFRSRIVAVREDSLPPEFLGEWLTVSLAEELEERGVDACGENGEFHTVVVDGPGFSFPIEIVPGGCTRADGHWYLDFALADDPGRETRGSGRT